MLGPMLRLTGTCREPVDVERTLADIARRLDALVRLAPMRDPKDEVNEKQPSQELEQPVHSIDSQVQNEAPSTAVVKVATLETKAATEPEQIPLQPYVWSPPSVWRIEAIADGADELSLMRVETARALADLGHSVVAPSSSSRTDTTALFSSPLPAAGAIDSSTILVGQDSEESGYPVDWIDRFNDRLRGVACATGHARKALVDHGLEAPVALMGFGVDHWERMLASADYRAPGKGFRFLHVSSCDVSKGVDLLLESFGRVFGREDDVCLILKPSGVLPQSVADLLDRLRSSDPGFPSVTVIEDDLDDAELKALYQQCHAFVAASRAEGFALPVAKALLSGLPVVTTAWGGHREYCDRSNSWLVDYRFRWARVTNDLIASVWAEPTANSLDDALWTAYQAAPEERFAKSWSGRQNLIERFTWKAAALRLAAFAEATKTAAGVRARKSRVGWITTWNVRCGIATHVEHLLSLVPSDEYVVFACRQGPQIRPDKSNCLRVWNSGKEANGLDEITRHLTFWSVNALVIQFNYGFFNHRELNAFIESVLAKGIVVIIELHSTIDPQGDADNFRLRDFLGAMLKCHRVLVHAPSDMDRLKQLGLVDNVMLMPPGILNTGRHLTASPRNGAGPLLASFGFCLPNKGLLELVEAVALLKNEGTAVRLLMLNAEHSDPISAPMVAKIKAAIHRFGLENDVEFETKFLDDEACLARLSEAYLLVNPYQQNGESASGSVRYGLASGAPVTVTPLPIFDDLGDAVFRMPGTSPAQIALGIRSALAHLKENSETARRIRNCAQRLVHEYDFTRQGARLIRVARALSQESGASNFDSAHRIARGVFLNTAKASCSIYESGRMVYSCIKDSGFYDLDYLSLDMIDVPVLAAEGKIRRLDGFQSRESDDAVSYDFWILNWHFITMAPHLGPESIQRLPGLKFSIVLELEPGNPLKLVPADVFDGYIALDPSTPQTEKIFPFPRPLEGIPNTASHSVADVPVIGSFGFGTPGKGFELLVEAVNREFDRAVVRVNIPRGTYTTGCDGIHGQDYAKYLASLCRRIAKPGIDVVFTHDFMSPDELVAWCAANDLNCFMYTRRQAGLSATTDQAILSGRPLLTVSNDTFRHIQRYIPPYPVIGLREAIETTATSVRKLQHDWSRISFSKTFHRMLARFGLITLRTADRFASESCQDHRKTILVASLNRSRGEDILDYPRRLADCLGRTGKYDIRRVSCNDLPDFEEQVAKLQPVASGAVLLGIAPTQCKDAARALKSLGGPSIILVDEVERKSTHYRPTDEDVFFIPRRPIVPYFTAGGGLREGPPGIWLIGFGAPKSNLEEVVARIARELPEAAVFLESPNRTRMSDLESRVGSLHERIPLGVRVSIASLPHTGSEMIAALAGDRLIIFYNDPERTDELESLCCLAMTTERSVAFTRVAPFRHFVEAATYVEDLAIPEIMSLGMAAQIKLCYEFGEGQLYAMMDRALSDPRGIGPAS